VVGGVIGAGQEPAELSRKLVFDIFP